ncbi:hypothetical protein [Gilvibacter sediminis]|uniref:hypothetical protein n=1 Tax=Gilvibacter sediminis TaxID=379071 RepID=UPI0023508103|nr:hypothetical protein [Gilvibacter sediminis]MDC7997531.1 hypothetical protein [Gilvibacter sediminis]
MIELKETIALLDTDEQLAFKRHLEELNRRSDTKNTDLFQMLCKGKTEGLDIALYGKPNKNALYVLSNRIQHRLIDFIATQSFSKETSADMNCLKLLLASRIFFEQKKIKLGFKTLEKALSAATQIEAYSILNEIYQTYLQYAHLQKRRSLQSLLNEAQSNNELYLQELKITTLYAQFQGKNSSAAKIRFDQQLATAMEAASLKLDHHLSYKSLFQLLSLATEYAQKNQAFFEILEFCQQIKSLIISKPELQGRYALYRMRSLHLIALSLFRNKQLRECQDTVSLLNEDLNSYSSYKALLRDKVALLQSLLYFYGGAPQKATNLLDKQPKTDLHAQLTLCMYYFHQGNFDKVSQLMRALNHSDAWYEKKMGWSWVVQKNIIEILLLIERDKLDLVLLRLNRFRRQYKSILKQKQQQRVVAFLKIVDTYYQNPRVLQDKVFVDSISSQLTQKNPLEEDIFTMSFYAWLKSKITGETLYQTTLDLVGTHGN